MQIKDVPGFNHWRIRDAEGLFHAFSSRNNCMKPFLSRKLWLLIAVLVIDSLSAQAATGWEIIREDGRDYVTLQNISDFYKFGVTVPAPSQVAPESSTTPLARKVSLVDGVRRLDVTTTSRIIEINGVKHWMSFPALIRDDKILVSRLDLSKTIEPALRPQAVSGYSPVKTVVLDPGHGGHDKGAQCAYGYEKNFALDVARRAKSLLEQQGYRVVMTRDRDEFIPLRTRAEIANNYNKRNAVFVSIHFNSSLQNRLASGFEVFSCTPRGGLSTNDDKLTRRDLASENGNTNDVVSAVLATAVHNAALGMIPVVDRGVKDARFAVLRLSKIPAILFEGGFVSNAIESRKIASEAWRSSLARAIVTGVSEYKKVAETRIPPRSIADYRHPSKTRMASRGGAPTVLTSAKSSKKLEPTVVLPTTQ